MKSLPNKESSGTPPQHPAVAQVGADAEELIALARRHFARDFPNAGRDGCLPEEVLRSCVLQGRPPDKALRSHMFGCSECFRVYSVALAGLGRETQPEQWEAPWWAVWAGHRSFGRAYVLAGLAALMLTAGAGTYLWRRQQQAGEQLASGRAPQVDSARVLPPQEARPQPSDAAPTPPDNVADTPPRQATPREPRRMGQAAPHPAEDTSPALLARASIDLAQYAVTRGAGNVTSLKVIKLPRLRTMLTLTLPEGSRPGRYMLGIVDGLGKLLVRASKAVSRDGKTLGAVMDFRKLVLKTYRLRVTDPAGFVQDYDIVVEEVKTPLRPKR